RLKLLLYFFPTRRSSDLFFRLLRPWGKPLCVAHPSERRACRQDKCCVFAVRSRLEPPGNRHGNREAGENAASPAGAYATLQTRSDEPPSNRSFRACAKHGSENLPRPRPSSDSSK